MFDVLEKFKKFFGVGNNVAREEATREEIAALVRAVAHGVESQNVLFQPGNEKCLAAFVEYGHSVDAAHLGNFFKEAPAELVKIYLERGEEISEENRMAILDRKDDAITEALLNSGSWVPFPYGSSLSHPLAISHDHHDVPETGAAVLA